MRRVAVFLYLLIQGVHTCRLTARSEGQRSRVDPGGLRLLVPGEVSRCINVS